MSRTFLKYTAFFISSIFLACKSGTPKWPDKYIIVDIQPFAGVSAQRISLVTGQLKEIYPHILIKPAIPLPYNTFFPGRNRYRADSLIKYLKDLTPEGHVTLGLTDRDISTTKGDVQDWGIMGLGYRPGNACIVSSFRLDNKNINPQFVKVCIHELGHTEGLGHCPVKTCFMRDAEGGNPINEEKEFCNKCRRSLINKGWRFN